MTDHDADGDGAWPALDVVFGLPRRPVPLPHSRVALVVTMVVCSACVLVVLLLLLGGCTSADVRNTLPFGTRPTTTQVRVVSDTPERAYGRSLVVIRQMGGLVTQEQPSTYHLSALVSGAVTLNVVITPVEGGSQLAASQHVSETYVAWAPVRVAEQFLDAYGKGE